MRKTLSALLLLFCLASLSAADTETGIASWYTADRSDALTANGEAFDNEALTAAHKTLIFGTLVEVKNTANGKTVKVRINDRGPYVEDRIIDLTPRAAKELDFYKDGIADVELTVLSVPKESETRYVSGEETGWYTLQIGSYTNTKNAWVVYSNLLSMELKPTIELIGESMMRISVKNIQAYKLDSVKEKLASIGITEPLVKGCKSPYN
jgi:rare lipoprotein A